MYSKGSLHLIYLKGEPEGCDVFYVRRAAGQTNFSAPLRVNSQPGSAVAIGTVRGAQLALGRNGRIHAAWNGSNQAEPKPAEGPPMLYARLNDAGNAFKPQRNLMSSTRHLDGGGSVAADGEGNVYVVWHASPAGAEADEQHRAVFAAKSTDDGKTFAPEKQANPDATGACGCCGLKAFADQRGRLGVLYRTATSSGGRDVTLLFSKDGGKAFASKTIGPWQASTCPMSTMALGDGPGELLTAMWETKGQIYHAEFIADKSGPVLPSAAGGMSGNHKHPAFAVNRAKGSALLMAWTEGASWGKGGSLAWAYFDLSDISKVSGRADGIIPAWSFAAVVAEPDGTFTILY